MRPSSGKKTEEKQKYCHSDICRWKSEVEITRGIDWLKKRIFEKINEFNWDKLPD